MATVTQREFCPFSFDEYVHLAVLGGGFLRTPYLHGISDIPDGMGIEGQDCLDVNPQVVHIPSALDCNGLNIHDPVFRRVLFTSDFVKRTNHDRAIVYNQQAAGVTFGFHQQSNHNIAHVMLNEATNVRGEKALVIDNVFPGFFTKQQTDINLLGVPSGIELPEEAQPSGFLVFISRYWQDLRGVDPGILLDHTIPLQFDLDFNGTWLAQDDPAMFQVTLPIWGAKGEVRCWDTRLGPNTYAETGSPLADEDGEPNGGSIRIELDELGLPILLVEAVGVPDTVVSIAIQDESGQYFTRNIMLQGGTPGVETIPMPAGRVGTPYFVSLPSGATVRNQYLPPGMGTNDGAIQGIPTEYGANYFVDVEFSLGQSFTSSTITRLFVPINRPQLEIMQIKATKGADNRTGEYYAALFMPYGTMLHYGGWAYEFRRFRSQANPFPFVRQVPYVYTQPSRRAGWDHENEIRAESERVRQRYRQQGLSPI